MSQLSVPTLPSPVYPESDGLPLAENTKQLRWIVVLYGNLSALYRDRDDVFVAADLFWYPVKNHPEIVIAPDTLVVFGRPKGDRPSYRQWEEGNVPLTVSMEVRSPSNTADEMAAKLAFCERHGVDEYYDYDPEADHLQVYLRRGGVLQLQPPAESFRSPKLGIRFDLSGPEMVVLRPDGLPFLTFEQIQEQLEQEKRQRLEAEWRTEDARRLIGDADRRAAEAERRAQAAEERAARLKELSRKARQQLASVDELAELDRLEGAD